MWWVEHYVVPIVVGIVVGLLVKELLWLRR